MSLPSPDPTGPRPASGEPTAESFAESSAESSAGAPAARHLNLGILAHVDAGKTSLTERLLFEAGVLDAPGSVDAGTTRTDSLDLERRRGITIRAAVTTFPLDAQVRVNLVDTPGHSDFVAEVERSLSVLDAAVLVVSAVEGVQPQTVVLWRALERVGLPALAFVNKTDRRGADVERVHEQLRRRLGATVVALSTCEDAGTAGVRTHPLAPDDERVVASVAEADEGVLAAWVDDGRVPAATVRDALRTGLAARALLPVVCGSAITGAGVEELRSALADLLAPGRAPERAPEGDLAATVFAVDRDAGGRRVWVRVWAGEVAVRDRLPVARRTHPVTDVVVSEPAGPVRRRRAGAGQVAALRGVPLRVGDTLGDVPGRARHRFPPPVRRALVEPADPRDRVALFAGLADLADEDPLIALQVEDTPAGPQAALSLHGEVQKEVVADLLRERYGVAARFEDTTVVCLERLLGTGSAEERIGERDNPYLAGLGVRVEPRPAGHGVEVLAGVEPGRLPPAFVAAAEEGVRDGLRQGPRGWAVTDCCVVLTSSMYWPRQSRPHQGFDKSISTVAGDFRHLGPVVVAAALARAGTVVCRPVDAVELDVPEPAYGPVVALLGRLGGSLLRTDPGDGYLRLRAHLPTAAVAALAARLPDLTSGEGALSSRLDHHAPVVGAAVPVRARRGPDPLDREAWFRDVPR